MYKYVYIYRYIMCFVKHIYVYLYVYIFYKNSLHSMSKKHTLHLTCIGQPCTAYLYHCDLTRKYIYNI